MRHDYHSFHGVQGSAWSIGKHIWPWGGGAGGGWGGGGGWTGEGGGVHSVVETEFPSLYVIVVVVLKCHRFSRRCRLGVIAMY